MPHISRSRSIRSVLAIVLSLMMALGLVADARFAVQAASPPLQASNLCALLPSGTGWQISSSDPSQGCIATNSGQAGGTYADLKEARITKYSSPSQAQAQLKSMYDAATRNGFGRWDTTTAFGDPGFGYEIIPINLSDPGGVFTRGSYLVIATAKRGTGSPDPGNALALLKQIDGRLGGGGDGPPADALRIILAGQKTSCAFKTTQAGWLYVMKGPAKIKEGAPGSGNYVRADAPVFFQTDDGSEFRINTDRFAMTVSPVGTLKLAGFGFQPQYALPVYYGTEVKIPGLAQQYDDRWYVNIELGPNEMHQLGPMGSFKIPCVPEEAVKITAGILETLIKLEAGKLPRKIDTGNAIVTPKSGGFFSALGFMPTFQANTYGIRIMVDARDPAKDKVTIYQGTAEVAPKSGGAQPVALSEGQTVLISQGTVSQPTNVIELPGIDSQSFPETGKAAAGIFMDYWRSHGALAQQGYPISGLIREKSDLNGKTYIVQYFERSVFEFHPEYAAPNDVLLSQLGTFQYKKKYPAGAPGQRPNNTAGSRLFPETGKRVGGKFLDYWNNNGGLAQQGLPLSDEFSEVSETDGKTYTVQYFERAVFEYHPENAGKPSEVLLSLLGVFFHKQKYGGGQPPSPPGGPPSNSFVVNAVDNDPENKLFRCDEPGARARIGQEPILDKPICFSFRYRDLIPQSGITSAVLHVAIVYRDGSDAFAMAVAQPFQTCYWGANKMPGCIYLHGAELHPKVEILDIDLLNLRAIPSIVRAAGEQPAVLAQLRTGVVHMVLQDDSPLYCAQLVINGGTGQPLCDRNNPTRGGGVAPPSGGATATPTQAAPPPTTPPGGGQCTNVPPSQNMTITPTNCARAGSTFNFEGFGFNPGERVGVYATGPDGQVLGAAFQVTADANGRTSGASGVRVETAANSPQGVWALTMEGVTSRRTAIGYFRVLAP